MLEKLFEDLNNNLIKSNINEKQRIFILAIVAVQVSLNICKLLSKNKK